MSEKPFMEQKNRHPSVGKVYVKGSEWLVKPNGRQLQRKYKYDPPIKPSHFKNKERVKVLFHYYTSNNGFKNYHVRCLVLNGERKGKRLSFNV